MATTFANADFDDSLGFPLCKPLINNLWFPRQATIHQDFDAVIIIDGKEGAGKSVLAQQIAYYLDVDHKITLSQIVFSVDDFKKAILSLKPGKAIVWDESRSGLNRRRSMGTDNIEVTDLLAESRQKNLFVILVMPSFYDMDRSAAVHRSRALIHVWYFWDKEDPDRPLKRGYFRFYNEDAKMTLFDTPYYRNKYPRLSGQFFDGRFVNHYVVDKEAYKKKKAEAMRAYDTDADFTKCPICKRKQGRFNKKAGLMVCGVCGHEYEKRIRT